MLNQGFCEFPWLFLSSRESTLHWDRHSHPPVKGGYSPLLNAHDHNHWITFTIVTHVCINQAISGSAQPKLRQPSCVKRMLESKGTHDLVS